MKPTIFTILLLFSNVSIAGICTDKLQEEANVFEVTCLRSSSDLPNGRYCMIQGFLSHPLFKNFNGTVADLQTPPDKFKGNNTSMQIISRIYRRGSQTKQTPLGFWTAYIRAESLFFNNKHVYPPVSYYFNAFNGKPTTRPKIKCIPL